MLKDAIVFTQLLPYHRALIGSMFTAKSSGQLDKASQSKVTLLLFGQNGHVRSVLPFVLLVRRSWRLVLAPNVADHLPRPKRDFSDSVRTANGQRSGGA